MTTNVFALANRARSTTALAALVAGAALIAVPTPSPAANVRPAHERHTATNKLGPGASQSESAITAAVLGGLFGAAATLALVLERNRRQSAQSDTSLWGDRAAAKVTRRGHDGSPDSSARLPDRDERAVPMPADAADAGRAPAQLPSGRSVIGYITVSADSDSGETARWAAAIEAACKRSDWSLVEIVADRENGRSLERPGLGYALGRIAGGHASGLVISDLQRLTRSIVDLGALMAWFRDANATLIALDLEIDTSTAEGHHVATTLIALSTRTKQRIADRTRNRLAERRAEGGSTGRPAVRDRPELMERIATMRAQGMTLQAIADQLNAENVPTLRGGTKWRPSSIQAASGYRRPDARDHLPRPNRGEK
jgi:DNA invertase Pin-like site-specific DNA recombinase